PGAVGFAWSLTWYDMTKGGLPSMLRLGPRPGSAENAGRKPGGRILRWARTSWIDIIWVTFIALNLLAMRLIPAWQTIPFLIIWVTLTAIYGFRLWRFGSTLLTVVLVTLATGGMIGWQVLKGKQDADYLAEVPLLAMMFVIMAWHARRRVAAMN